MNPEHKVYDDHDEEPVTRSDLRAMEGDGETTEPRTGHLKPVSTEGSSGSEHKDPGELSNLGGSEKNKNSFAPASLAAAELGSGFNPSGVAGGKLRGLLKTAGSHKKGIAIGGGGFAGVLAIILSLTLLFIPLKIEHIVNNLQSRFYSSSNNAIGDETQTLFERYISTKVLPAYKSCGTTISHKCTPKDFGDGPVGNLYRTWSNARLENKLAKNYGIEFQYKQFGANKTWVVKGPGTDPGGDNIGTDGENIAHEFDSRSSARAASGAALGDALQHETRWKNVMVRYQVGRLLDEKYGIKRCLMFCGTRDQLADKKDAKKLAAQLYITQRVITPRTQTLGIVLTCLLGGDSCNPEQTQPTTIQDSTDGSPVDAENPETDGAARQAAQSLAQTFTGASADELASEYALASEKGFQKYLLEKVLTKVGLGSISSQAADAVPIVGAVSQAANAISFADRAGPAVQKLGYITNASAAATLFMMYRTYADEIHTGHVNATEVGSMASSLGAGNSGPASDPEKGGTASAENTPLYKNIIDGSSQQTASVINNALPAKAYADSKSNSGNEYTCEGGKPVPSGKLVCNEEVLGQSNSTLDAAHNFLNSAAIQPVTTVAHAISGVTGAISNALGGILTSIPGVSNVADFVGGILQPFFQDVINLLIPSPFGTNMSGGRKFDMMAAGADVSGNNYAQTGLGGQKLSNQQLADITNDQQQQEQQSFDHQSFFARMFNTDSQYSLVSKIAMSVPIGTQASAQSGVASLLNPLGTISHGFSSMLSEKANAAATSQPDPFGVVQYGYPRGSIPDDPKKYWDDHCSDNSAQAYQNDTDLHNAPGGQGWVGAAAHGTPDPNTGMPVNTTTNPCLLIKAAVGAAGGYMDTSNLTQFDLAEQDSTSSGGGSVPNGSTVPPGGIPFPFPPNVGVVSPSSWSQDQGVDISTLNAACGKNAPEVALGNGVIVGRGISGFGPDAPILHITDGPLAGRYIYYGHAGDKNSSNGAGRPPNTEVGDKVTAGQVITYTGCGIVGLSSGPHLEIGIWPKGSSPDSTFPARYQTSAEMLQILKQGYQAQGNK